MAVSPLSRCPSWSCYQTLPPRREGHSERVQEVSHQAAECHSGGHVDYAVGSGVLEMLVMVAVRPVDSGPCQEDENGDSAQDGGDADMGLRRQCLRQR